MKFSRFYRSAAIASVAAIALAACSSDDGGDSADANGGGGETTASGNLIGGGASSQEAAMTAWTSGITEVHPDLTVQYDPVGSGAGREGFIAGQYTFAGSDSAMDADEQEQACGAANAFHVPSYISPVAVAFNLEGIDTLNMNPDTIAKVFAGEISSWDDEEIAEQNPDADLPATDITVVHRSDESGTTENFTDYLNGAAGDSWEWEAADAFPEELTGESAQQTSGVVSLTSDTDGAITYADASQIGDLSTVAVGVGEDYVEYSSDAAAAAVETAEEDTESEGARVLDRSTEEEGVYPIVMISYHIFCDEYDDENMVEQVKAFGNYVISEDGQAAAEESAGSAPISDTIRDEATERIEAISVAG
ncbi:phosphate ABC transporter substrate-binding protein PstS [Yaniella halotolerans]|uniref:phosphate ABC transporter substrate-binding protein PstS n=1 Tax=Yaniella halotolerans TaxID=225453 RepID=UPI0003B577FB|nr:phosphate ABC transporter substrate-binding protein PstS [Yaniella halotolerans]